MQKRTLCVYRGRNQPEEKFEAWDCDRPQLPICVRDKIITKIEVLCAKGYPQWVVEYGKLIKNCSHIAFAEGWTATAFALTTDKLYEYNYGAKEWLEKKYLQTPQQEYCSATEE